MNEDKREIANFLVGHHLAVIATIGATGPAPESALVAFVEDENLNLYIQTGDWTRKAANINQNPNVSLVIGLELNEMATLQYEGISKLLTKDTEIKECRQRFLEKESPSTPEYLAQPGVQFYKITPKWVRLYRAGHQKILELSL